MGIDFNTSSKITLNSGINKNKVNYSATAPTLTSENIRFLLSQGLKLNQNERNTRRK